MDDLIETALKKLKISESRSTIMLARLTLSKAMIDRTLCGYTHSDTAEHIAFECARQFEVPLTKNTFQALTGKKINIQLLQKIRSILKSLGYKPKPFNIVKLAEKVIQRTDFPKGLASKFVEVIKKLSEIGYPQRENPLVVIASCVQITSEILNYDLPEKKAIRLIFRNSKDRRANFYNVKKFREIIKNILKGEYIWKEQNSSGNEIDHQPTTKS